MRKPDYEKIYHTRVYPCIKIIDVSNMSGIKSIILSEGEKNFFIFNVSKFAGLLRVWKNNKNNKQISAQDV